MGYLSQFKNYFEQDFRINNKYFLIISLIFLAIRIFWAAYFPMTNDEVYYWDWSRYLQLSYLDAPPLVAWCAYLGKYFLEGALGARFLFPFMHFFSCLFLIGSTKLICQYEGVRVKNRHIFTVLLLTETIPAFSLEGILLLPDGPLLLGISGALFFILKAVTSSKPDKPLSIKYAFLFGLFLGISALAKYHAFPIAVGFFLASIYFRSFKTFTRDFLFWFVVIAISACIASPVFIWNLHNHWASFQFQGQHGFADMDFNIKPFARYILGMIFYLWPWFFFALIAFVWRNLFSIASSYRLNKLLQEEFPKERKIKSVHIFTIFPFLILFFIILLSALGKQALPHWALPGFFLLIPSFASQWNPFAQSCVKRNKIFITLSLLLTLTFPTLASIDKFNQFIISSFVYFTGNADPLAQVYQWQNLQEELRKNKTITVDSNIYSPQNLPCRKPYEIASLRWYWTAQIAFYFKNQPRVYNFDFSNSSFYSWRDSLKDLSGCSIMVLGSKNHFNKEQLEQVMNIEIIDEFSLPPYIGNKIIMIKGLMKDYEVLNTFDKNNKKNIRY